MQIKSDEERKIQRVTGPVIWAVRLVWQNPSMEMPPFDRNWDLWLKRFGYLGIAMWGLFVILVIARNF